MNEGRVDLEGILYDEDGSFMPMGSNHGNISGELADLRNTYMEAEREYFERLLADSYIREYFEECMDKPADELFDRAMAIQDRLETGELETAEEKQAMRTMTPEEADALHMNRLERAEGIMCLLFAAAKDKVRILELSPMHSYSGRSR
jgi:hypothetical protein